ncbi:MAG: acetyltransferase [Candidatus Midichloriaceae bacterium]|jgi:N-acetylglutamate synthase-like GNAT family acetyltransferase|nr:acetyltransferase [Candidatus Midichloriaceae bacterium]
MNNIAFKIVEWGTKEYLDIVKLRHEMLRKPLGLVTDKDDLEGDKTHVKIIGLNEEEVIAIAALEEINGIYKMQGVAVKDEYQNKGIGSKMIHFCENYAKQYGIKSIFCHSLLSASNFYEKLGYVDEGHYVSACGIPYIKMTKVL